MPPEENLVVEPTATVAVTPDELAAVSPDELVSTSEATKHSVEETAETPVIDTSEVVSSNSKSLSSFNSYRRKKTSESVFATTTLISFQFFILIKANEGENVSSTIEDEVAVIDSKNDNGSISKTVNDTNDEDLQLPAPETASRQLIEVALDRLVSDIFLLLCL